MNRKKILIVDDDSRIAELISLYMNKEGYDTKEIYTGENIIKEFNEYSPNLVILDLMLPGLDGYAVCQEIRKISNVPIIMSTARGETFDRVLGLELGADDYIVKPFEPNEMVARVKAVLRRYNHKEDPRSNRIECNDLSIDPEYYVVKYNDETIDMPYKEFELLFFLASHPNKVYSREQLLNQIWGYDFMGDSRTVDVHVKRLRERIPFDDKWGIKTVRSVGYKFVS